ncbi:pyridoxal-phosphate dependent enzyme [Anaerosalibacter bizertensis]|uniref:1-aminocyclopropane-1-carboxylate deaminase/D-cysteine desulfhydrase n=1 Tax=Anaerosalibacter bizertensis TaxID=932217 RepID=UPI0012B36414|nr:pyridoxal-phosphate dependent enzyme [Anaerosalibacter bizertensis]MBU5294119.1 pyridoxal-phosphate dependent enzyme [Anaerosalibacter bizertensis]
MNRKEFIFRNTPLYKLDSFKTNNIYIKRDDMTDPVCGGNKARKLQYFIEEILNNGHNYIVTYGSKESNHCRITAAFASKYNIPCTLILAKPERNMEISYNGNYFLYDLLDADIIWSEVDNVSSIIDETMEKLGLEGYNPYFIPGGGHGPIGTHGYVKAYEEIENQRKDLNIDFDYIFLASGTGTTQAGLVIGNKLYENKEKIIGISVARKEERGKKVIYDSVCEYIKAKNIPLDISEDDIIFLDSYIGEGYGDIYGNVLDTIKNVAKTEGVLLDPIYTGKAFYGMLSYLENKNLKGKNVLFIHSGGLPLVFNYTYKFKDNK